MVDAGLLRLLLEKTVLVIDRASPQRERLIPKLISKFSGLINRSVYMQLIANAPYNYGACEYFWQATGQFMIELTDDSLHAMICGGLDRFRERSSEGRPTEPHKITFRIPKHVIGRK